jgi:hypothetical protein
MIYVLGDLPKKHLEEWKQLLYNFHTDEVVQDEVDEVLRSAQHYLKWQTSRQGQGYAAARPIPTRTRLCYYSGVLTRMALRSNHRITLGTNINGFRYFVEIDGCTTKNVVGDAGTLGLLQMVNHSCNPNCRIEPVDTRSGLILLILETLRDIGYNEEITINYDAEASLTSKSRGLTFWQWRPPRSAVKFGLRRIKCGCAGIGRVCPNDLWRDEHENSGGVIASSPTTPERSEGDRTVRQSITVDVMQQPEETLSLHSQLGGKTDPQTLAFQAPEWPQAATLTIAALATDSLASHQRQTGNRSVAGRQADCQGNRIEGGKDETVEGRRRSLADVSRANSRWKRVSAEGSDMSRGPPRRLQQTKIHFPPDGRVAERQPVSAQSCTECSRGQSCDLGHTGAPTKRVIR